MFLSLLVNVVIFYQTSDRLLETSVWMTRFSGKKQRCLYISDSRTRRAQIRDVYSRVLWIIFLLEIKTGQWPVTSDQAKLVNLVNFVYLVFVGGFSLHQRRPAVSLSHYPFARPTPVKLTQAPAHPHNHHPLHIQQSLLVNCGWNSQKWPSNPAPCAIFTWVPWKDYSNEFTKAQNMQKLRVSSVWKSLGKLRV